MSGRTLSPGPPDGRELPVINTPIQPLVLGTSLPPCSHPFDSLPNCRAIECFPWAEQKKPPMIIGLNSELFTMSYVSKGQRPRKTTIPVKETAVIKGRSMQSEGKVGFG